MISFEFAGKLQENCRIEEENKRGRKTEEEKKKTIQVIVQLFAYANAMKNVNNFVIYSNYIFKTTMFFGVFAV